MKFHKIKPILFTLSLLSILSIQVAKASEDEMIDKILNLNPHYQVSIQTHRFNSEKIVVSIDYLIEGGPVGSTSQVTDSFDEAFIKLGRLILYYTNVIDPNSYLPIPEAPLIDISNYTRTLQLDPIDVVGVSRRKFEIFKSKLNGTNFNLKARKSEGKIKLCLNITSEDGELYIFRAESDIFASALTQLLRLI